MEWLAGGPRVPGSLDGLGSRPGKAGPGSGAGGDHLPASTAGKRRGPEATLGWDRPAHPVQRADWAGSTRARADLPALAQASPLTDEPAHLIPLPALR